MSTKHEHSASTMRTFYKLLIILTICTAVLKTIQFYLTVSEKPHPSSPVQQVTMNDQSKINVSIYYEALCPDSRRFILEQLLPAYELMPTVFNLNLVPYGKANTKEENEELIFSCQHGPAECLANKIHACAIKHTEENPYMQLKYIACMINDNYNPEYAGKKCASETGVHYNPIANCSESDMGSLLLKANGERTKALKPRAAFIPTVELNGMHKMQQEEVLQNFLSEVCKTLAVKPAECY